ncbi:hypothetical protein, partial [endosymbiont of Lamellibrachia barhami]|uniref:hypothetical protein n=1 Tax=endosymbiont of Lamellibrachia barhami TaxID=205975 RepID=UPI0015A9F2EE
MSINNESPSVLAHINAVQAIIARLSNNSSLCKNWCITLSSVLLAVFIKEPNLLFSSYILLVPVIFFYLIDTYYLALECQFRMHHEQFVKKLNLGDLNSNEIFVFNIEQYKFKARQKAIFSFSTTGFYGLLALAVLA